LQGFAGFFAPINARASPTRPAPEQLQGMRKNDTFSPQAWRGDDGARQVKAPQVPVVLKN